MRTVSNLWLLDDFWATLVESLQRAAASMPMQSASLFSRRGAATARYPCRWPPATARCTRMNPSSASLHNCPSHGGRGRDQGVACQLFRPRSLGQSDAQPEGTTRSVRPASTANRCACATNSTASFASGGPLKHGDQLSFVRLPPTPRRPAHAHRIRPRPPEPYIAAGTLIQAVNLAIFLHRPLLLEGGAGCGKSMLARRRLRTGAALLLLGCARPARHRRTVHLRCAIPAPARRRQKAGAGQPPRDPADPVAYRKLGRWARPLP